MCSSRTASALLIVELLAASSLAASAFQSGGHKPGYPQSGLRADQGSLSVGMVAVIDAQGVIPRTEKTAVVRRHEAAPEIDTGDASLPQAPNLQGGVPPENDAGEHPSVALEQASQADVAATHNDQVKGSSGALVQQLEVAAANGSATLRFVHENQPLEYRLTARSIYAPGAVIVHHTDTGDVRVEAATLQPRTFEGREPGAWASATLRDDGSISGLFEHRGRVIQVWPQEPRASGAGASLFERAHLAAVVSREESPWFQRGEQPELEIDSDWDVPHQGPGSGDPLDEEGVTSANIPRAAAAESWGGTKWWGGGQCYPGDDQMSSFTVGLIADNEAYKLKQGEIQAWMEEQVSKASFVYESQMHVQLVVGNVKIYESTSGAPSYAVGCSSDFMRDKLNDMKGAGNQIPFEGSTQLFTGCTGSNIGGLAWVGTICSQQGYNTGTNQMQVRDTWLTFAHELGHNFDGKHSWEEGKHMTGGIMDYGDGKLNGHYQFNTKYRKGKMCEALASNVNKCQGKFQNSPVQNVGKDCWDACGKKGGYCPAFCGGRNACCRYGAWFEPPECDYVGGSWNHECVRPR